MEQQDLPADEPAVDELTVTGVESPEAVPPEIAPPGEAPRAPPLQEEEIVVIGSRSKRSVFLATAPIVVMTRKQIEQIGAQGLTIGKRPESAVSSQGSESSASTRHR